MGAFVRFLALIFRILIEADRLKPIQLISED